MRKPPARRATACAALLAVVFLATVRPARAAEAPYDPRSTAGAPCGTGTPPPGHDSPVLRPGAGGATLAVRQDGDRLCYVADGVADAPVLHVRRGEDLVVTLRNEITRPAAIEAVMGAGRLAVPNAPVPALPGFYPVVPGMHHTATGRTNLHVHGFAVPPVAPQDDVMTVCTDPAVGGTECGRRAFTYRWHVPADMPEGLYWYHPHVHGEVQAQMLMGLSGAIVVEGPSDDARRAAGIEERLLIVRQTQDRDAARTPAASMTSAGGDASRAPPATSAAGAIDTAHELLCSASAGIDELSVNDTPVTLGNTPDDALAPLRMTAGRPQFWRVLNAATDAFLALALVDAHGRSLPLQVVARDGVPLQDDRGVRLPAPPTTDAQPVPPGGRIELTVPPLPAGTRAWLVTRAVDTGCAGDRLPERRLAWVESVEAHAATAARADPIASPTAAAVATAATKPAPPDLFSGLLARPVDHRRVIAFAEYPRPGDEDRTDFYIVERRPGAVLRPYERGDAPAITVRAGTTEEWVIENWTQELHTFHIHQLHFRVLEIDGVPVARPDLLDVVEVPYATATGYRSPEGPVRPGRVTVKLAFPAALAGDLPFHCHLVDHEDNGMMAVLRVLPAGGRQRSPRTLQSLPGVTGTGAGGQ